MKNKSEKGAKQVPAHLILLAGALGVVSACTASAAELEVGMGRCVITPQHSQWLAGYAGRNAPSDGAIHDLYAKAMVIRDESGDLAAIVTTDLLGISADLSRRTAELAKERFGIPRERLIFTASHTHSGPVIHDRLQSIYPLDEEQRRVVTEYTEALPGHFLEAIQEGVDTLEPGLLKWGIGQARFAVNRREYTPDGVINRKNPIGPVDHDVPVLAACDPEGKVRGVLFGYACHNTTLCIQQFCGDYAGFAQAAIEERMPGTMALFTEGCGGDQNPLPRRKMELCRQYGQELGEAVVSVLKAEMSPVTGPIRAVYQEAPLQLGEPPSREELEKQATSENVYVKKRAQNLLASLDEKGALDTTYPYPIQLWQFSDTLQMTVLAGEVVVDYALLLKHLFGREKQYIIAYANDLCGYIPSLRVLREGGYEGADAMLYYGFYGPWAGNVEETILSAVEELARSQ